MYMLNGAHYKNEAKYQKINHVQQVHIENSHCMGGMCTGLSCPSCTYSRPIKNELPKDRRIKTNNKTTQKER